MSDNSGKTKSASNLRIIAECGIFAALVFIGTELRIPTALGFMNLGDGVILIASYFIGPAAFFSAAIGSALGDLIAGYPVYIAPTFVIKGLMGLVAALISPSMDFPGGFIPVTISLSGLGVYFIWSVGSTTSQKIVGRQ